jgi:low temperature requirement protein LtrA
VRLALIAAMAAMLVVALAIPEAFDDLGLLFAGGLAVVRAAHIVLFLIASRDDPGLRSSVVGLSVSTALGVGLIAVASLTDGALQGALWVLALALDMGGPAFFGVAGWRLEPEHFAERHGLIVIIALGESIVAIGVGAEHGLDAGVVVAAVLGVFTTAALWWLYFDVVALVAARRLEHAHAGAERNRIARDSFSFLHLPMVAGIVLVALGFKKTLEHVGDAMEIEIAVAMLGGAALYLLAHVAFRWRNVHRFSTQRVVAAIVLAALTPAAIAMPAEATLAAVLLVLAAVIVDENHRFAELRDRLRHQVEA